MPDVFEELIETVRQRKETETILTAKKREFADSISIETEDLEKLKEKEESFRCDVLEKLKDEESITVNNSLITRQTRVSTKVTNPQELKDSIRRYNEFIKNYLDVEAKEFTARCFEDEVVIKKENKKEVEELIKNYHKVRGQLLGGTEQNETHFLTVKL